VKFWHTANASMLAFRLLFGLAHVTVGNNSLSWLYSSDTSFPRKIFVCHLCRFSLKGANVHGANHV
jgi:hypothetical protein